MFYYLNKFRNITLNWWNSLDTNIFYAILVLIGIGVVLLITVTPFIALRIHVSPYYFIKNQIFYLILSFAMIIIFSSLSDKRLFQISIIGFIVSFFLMCLIFLIGSHIKGATRWIYLFGFSLQPSEFIKIFVVMVCAYLYEYLYNFKQSMLIIYLSIFIIYAIIIILLLLQPDLGMSILISFAIGVIIFMIGISYTIILILTIIGSFILISLYFIFPHVNYRVNSFFLEGKSYQVNKALEAISSGKIFGKGPGMSEVKMFLPDAHSDFIFSIAAEEFGLIFISFLICVYLYIIARVLKHIERETRDYKILALSGLIAIFALQVFIHIGANISLIPAKGMTLPFISYGGSSLLSTSCLMGIILNLTKKGITTKLT